jgi:hypothetical protein
VVGIVIVIVIANLIVAALVNGNEPVEVIEPVDDGGESGRSASRRMPFAPGRDA